jgi:hypothetical protein
MARAISVNQLYSKRRKLLPFDGKFAKSFGNPELKGAWLVWGGSGSGKTSLVLQLCKYLTRFGRVCYNSKEEGDSESFKMACQREKMEECKRRFIIVDNESISEAKERLKKKKAPDFYVIDSLQYAQMSYAEYLELIEAHKNKLFIIISHADGREPEGKVAKKIRYDVSVKIRVEGYAAFIVSRYGGGSPFIIWEKGADEYHGFNLNK